MNGYTKQITQKVKGAFGDEAREVIKDVKRQVGGDKSAQGEPHEPINWYGNVKDVGSEEARKIQARGMQNVRNLEEEIKMILAQKEEANRQRLAQSLVPRQESQSGERAPAIMPSSPSRKRAARGGGGVPKTQSHEAERQKKIT
ncbi:hypothetical protein A3D00_01795 [Candidatus Woesebacteria bacterium RIFCSPHIGHO2_02_FULL_38_9]|uniref:Uncharacterized protein n=1 Tax=Candidatus Woesebacteria bacterium RIFCSPHIGHO2_01_FULL_39_28 TaxID=1802496 RepID=A0A1F7YFK1_9BACT|nr:MAG: hypothetical protein A2627_03660 [Candidatus Woesebacteria bacterium RIFCSPHIGHO2_01_FULL_39_28]OGM33660.1 MAG: hypothetical protein A3D00_01795 [Candidatus Woesebacteria bacterium RIFCSPHIGHO2_02_FULL_38_9]OGM58519.1 MAG: hypothetical protein A3A50_00670 [Candidatus Woesebacteria bacterium RIFCSPLOWO2_01_FULL_38_20]